MNTTDASYPTANILAETPARARSAGMPWYCYLVAFGAACSPMGTLWDISWHSSIGRDTFWTPAHMMIYLGGAVPGLVCGWLVLKNTFWTVPADRVPSVRLWGFYGPFGAWVAIWGAFMMIASGPFDDWWHNAYGLDVAIISPPHMLLALGMYGTALGALFMVVSWQNNLRGQEKTGVSRFLLFCYAVMVLMAAVFTTEYNYPNQQHQGLFYKVMCLAFPLYLVGARRVTGLPWAATGASLIYMFASMLMVWILPLFHAQPKLAPIYNPVDHMVPPPFPMLLVIPALGIDLTFRIFGARRSFWSDNLLAILLGAVFFLLLLAAQWPFSIFLLSPAAHGRFFAGNAMWTYWTTVDKWTTQFWNTAKDPVAIETALIAIAIAIMPARLALALGNWLLTVRR